MTRSTPQQRLATALTEIRYETQEAKYHDRLASEARKRVQRAKGVRDRAEKAIERQAAALIFKR
jgi:hypothetical protein